MMFCKRNFSADRYSLGYTPTTVKNIERIRLQNGKFDTIHISKNISRPYSDYIPQQIDEWDYDTILLAFFDGNLLAGNILYSLSQISHFRIKVREAGTFKWLTFEEIPIRTIDDVSFDRYYKYCKSNQEYEFALVPVLNSIEGNININRIYSEFQGMFIMEKDKSFSTMIDVNISVQKNRPSAYIQTINRQYPYVFSAGNNNFYTGNFVVEFIADNSDISVDKSYNDYLKNSWVYRKNLMEFFCNGRPKIIKLYDGRMWMVSIINQPSETKESSILPRTSFEWVEIGDCLSSNDLYDNNFIDVNFEGS
jgi:hypothetical protein